MCCITTMVSIHRSGPPFASTRHSSDRLIIIIIIISPSTRLPPPRSSRTTPRATLPTPPPCRSTSRPTPLPTASGPGCFPKAYDPRPFSKKSPEMLILYPPSRRYSSTVGRWVPIEPPHPLGLKPSLSRAAAPPEDGRAGAIKAKQSLDR